MNHHLRNHLRHLGVLAAAALLAAAVATDASAAARGGGFGGGHIDGEFGAGAFRGGPIPGSVSSPPPVFNPSSPYTVTQSPETHVSPASPGSVFGND